VIIKDLTAKAKTINEWCNGKAFVAGDNITYLDFVLYELSELCNFIFMNNKFFEEFPALKAHHNRVHMLPAIHAYREKQTPLTFNNWMAAIGGEGTETCPWSNLEYHAGFGNHIESEAI
jgi:glutathione S-transferase